MHNETRPGMSEDFQHGALDTGRATAALRKAVPGATVTPEAGVWPRVVARAMVQGRYVEVHTYMAPTQHRGDQAFCEVRVFAPTYGVTLRRVGEPMAAAPYETLRPLTGDPGSWLCGAPKAVVEHLAAGSLGARLWAHATRHGGGVARFVVGLRETQRDHRAGGVQMVGHGWPATPRAVWCALDAALGVADDLAALAARQPGGSFEHGGEMQQYAVQRAGRVSHGVAVAFVTVTAVCVAVGGAAAWLVGCVGG